MRCISFSVLIILTLMLLGLKPINTQQQSYKCRIVDSEDNVFTLADVGRHSYQYGQYGGPNRWIAFRKGDSKFSLSFNDISSIRYF